MKMSNVKVERSLCDFVPRKPYAVVGTFKNREVGKKEAAGPLKRVGPVLLCICETILYDSCG